ncbi:MAG: hypothetical protein MPN21_01335 [Thermoanaerobaculia bacterium]|nr:hypothetical protein [Thermoanaerobaculia bacterium]
MRFSIGNYPFRFLLPILLTFLLSTPVAGVEDVDTFYLRLYQDGAELAAAGQYHAAASKLRLACFGMLDHPSFLGPCLGRLLVTQNAAEVPADEIEATVDRLLEVEKRFQGWSEPADRYAPSDDLRRRVEALFVRFGTADSLARIPGLGDVALAKQAERIAAMPIEERRRELNLLVQRQARVPIWHVMSAELSLEEGDPRAAASAAGDILRKFEGNTDAHCVLGRALAAQDQCQGAVVEHLQVCPEDHPRRGEIDLALTTCLVEAERWIEADGALRRLPPALQDQRSVRRLRRQIEKGLSSAPASSSATDRPSATDGAEAPQPTGGSAGTDETGPSVAASPVYAPPPGIEEEDLQAEEPVVLATGPSAVPRADLPAEFEGLSQDERETLRRVRDALAAEQRHLYPALWTPMKKLARRHDDLDVAQRLAGSLAFRLGRWRDAVRFLRRDESLVSSRPQLQLELAVALHYQGERDEARNEFRRCRPLLASTAWVEYWAAELGNESEHEG